MKEVIYLPSTALSASHAKSFQHRLYTLTTYLKIWPSLYITRHNFHSSYFCYDMLIPSYNIQYALPDESSVNVCILHMKIIKTYIWYKQICPITDLVDNNEGDASNF